MATLEAIKLLTIRGQSQGLDKVAADLDRVEASQKAVAASSTVMATTTDSSARKVTSVAANYDRLRQSLDADYKAQLQFEKGQRLVNSALEQGVIAPAEAAAQIELLRQRQVSATNALGSNVVALKAHAEASGHSTVAAAMFGSAVHRTVDSLASGLPITTIAIQQGNELVGAFGAAGGVAGAMEALLAPQTLMIVGFTAAVAVFKLLDSASHQLEDDLKRHEEVIRQLKDAYGEAAKGAQEYAAASRKAADHEVQNDLQRLSDELNKQSANVAQGMLEPQIDPNTGNQVLALARDYEAFGAELDKLRASMAAGKPDLVAFKDAIIDRENLEPGNVSLHKMGDEIIALTDDGIKAQLALKGTSDAITSISRAVIAGQYGLDAYTKGMEALSQIAVPSLTNAEQAQQAYSQINGSHVSREQKDDAYSAYQDALQRDADSRVPLPKVNPLRDLTTWDVAAAKASKATENAYRDLIKSANDRIGQMQVELATVGMSASEAEKYRIQQELLASATDKGRKITEAQREEISKIADQYGLLAQKLAEAKLQEDLLFERRQLGRSDLEQTVAETLRSAGLPEDLNSAAAAQVRLNEELKLAKGYATDFVNTFVSDLRQGKSVVESLGDALNGLADKLIQMAENQLISSLFSNLMGVTGISGASSIVAGTGGLFANGAAFSGGNVVPFANGGIVDRPTMFAMGGTRTGVAGEAGPEAIMPLRRLPNGRLGVENAAGGQGGGAMLHFAPVTNITITGDATADTVAMLNRQLDIRDRKWKSQLPDEIRKLQRDRKLAS